jgi:integrase
MSFKRDDKIERPVIDKDKLFEMLRGLDHYRGLVVGLMGRAGLRIGEVYVLKIEDVNFDQRTIFIRRRQYRGKIENYTKTKTSYCNLPVYDEVLHLVRRFFTWESGWIFSGINYHSFYGENWRYICKKYDLPEGFTTQCLRHSFGYILLKDGINIKAIQRLMRHKNI